MLQVVRGAELSELLQLASALLFRLRRYRVMGGGLNRCSSLWWMKLHMVSLEKIAISNERFNRTLGAADLVRTLFLNRAGTSRRQHICTCHGVCYSMFIDACVVSVLLHFEHGLLFIDDFAIAVT